jgi:type IV secretion system protein TrbE
MWGMIANAMGGNAKLNEVAENNKFVIQDCISENESLEVKFGLYNMNFVLMNEDKESLYKDAYHLRSALTNFGFTVRDEKENCTEAYLGSLPSHGGYNCRVEMMDSRVWSHSIPLSSVNSGEKYCPNPYYPKNSPPLLYALTDQNNIYRFNNFVGDVGHTKILGPTGAGKTTLLNLIMAQHRKYKNSRQFVLDCNNSSMIPILAMQGVYIDVSDDNNITQLSLFDEIESDIQIEVIIDWLCDLFASNSVDMDALKRSEVRNAVIRMKDLRIESRKFTNLVFDDEDLRESFKDLCNTNFGQLINGNQNIFTDKSLIGFEIGKLKGKMNDSRHLQPLIILLIHKLTMMFEDRVPTLLILDEAWLFLDHPTFAAKIKEWLKTLRKLNVSVIFASQSLSDVAGSSIYPVIVESCMTSIYLPNDVINSNESIRKQYLEYGLNEDECLAIGRAIPKKEYFIKKVNNSRLVDFNIGEIALQFISLDKNEDKNLFLKHYTPSCNQYLVDYLSAKNFPEASDLVKNILNNSEVEYV